MFKIGDKLRINQKLKGFARADVVNNLGGEQFISTATGKVLAVDKKNERYLVNFSNGKTFFIYDDEVESCNKKSIIRGHSMTKIFSDKWKPGQLNKKVRVYKKKINKNVLEKTESPADLAGDSSNQEILKKISKDWGICWQGKPAPVQFPVDITSQEMQEFDKHMETLAFIKSIENDKIIDAELEKMDQKISELNENEESYNPPF